MKHRYNSNNSTSNSNSVQKFNKNGILTWKEGEESSTSMVSKVPVGLLNQVVFLPCLYTTQSYTPSPPSVYHDLRGELSNIVMYAVACTY